MVLSVIVLLKLQVAKENADVIIMDDNFRTIVNVARWGRAVYINIQKFVQFQLTVNVVALVINFASACISGVNQFYTFKKNGHVPIQNLALKKALLN